MAGHLAGRLADRSARRISECVTTACVTIACVVSLLLPTASDAAPRHGKRHAQAWHGYGFLPGYRPPDQMQWQRSHNRPPYWWYGYPQFYHGRWNGGGFGPCWTQTPIGLIWNCGK